VVKERIGHYNRASKVIGQILKRQIVEPEP
jgi:hypothetical protein